MQVPRTTVVVSGLSLLCSPVPQSLHDVVHAYYTYVVPFLCIAHRIIHTYVAYNLTCVVHIRYIIHVPHSGFHNIIAPKCLSGGNWAKQSCLIEFKI